MEQEKEKITKKLQNFQNIMRSVLKKSYGTDNHKYYYNVELAYVCNYGRHSIVIPQLFNNNKYNIEWIEHDINTLEIYHEDEENYYLKIKNVDYTKFKNPFYKKFIVHKDLLKLSDREIAKETRKFVKKHKASYKKHEQNFYESKAGQGRIKFIEEYLVHIHKMLEKEKETK